MLIDNPKSNGGVGVSVHGCLSRSPLITAGEGSSSPRDPEQDETGCIPDTFVQHQLGQRPTSWKHKQEKMDDRQLKDEKMPKM